MLRRLAPLLFILSGLAGLVLQVAWFRLLALSLGGTLAATTAVLTAFMAGLGAGAFAASRLVARVERPLRAYGLLELGAGAAALATLPLLRGLDSVHAALAGPFEDSPGPLLVLKIVLAALCLVPATFFMGGTLPVLCQALAAEPETSGGDTGGLYALNTLGAVGGTLLAAFWLLKDVGLTGSVVLAAGLDVAVAAVVLAVGRAERASAPARGESHGLPARGSEASRRLGLLSALLFAVGLAGLAYEVLWTRVLAFYFGSGAQAFALVLAVVLAGLALGAFLGGELADRTRRPVLVLAVSQALVAAAVLHQAWRFPHLPDFLYQLALRFEGGLSFRTFTFLLLVGAVQLVLPASLAMGAAFPAAVRAAATERGGTGAIVGRLAAANTLGTIPGAVVAAYVLVPLLGLQGALFATAALSLGVAGVAAWALAPGPRARRLAPIAAGAGMAGLVVIATAIDPLRLLAGSGVFSDEGENRTLERLVESAHGTVSVSVVDDSRGRWRSLSIDAVNVAGTSPPLLSCQVLQGQLPLLLHPAPRSVLHVGFGSGGTAAAVATHPEVERIDVAEINPAVLRMADEEFRAVNRGVLRDPRVRVQLEDGRNHVLVTRRRYDCILSDSIHPRYRGNSSLYTVDYFRACREKLEPGGLVSTWLPIYSLTPDALRSIVRSMREVFPATSVWYLNSTVNEFVILVGREGGGRIDARRLEAAFAEPAVRASLEEVGVTTPAHLLDFFVAQGAELDPFLDGAPLHRDDRPWVELESAAVLDRTGSWRVNLRNVLAVRTSVVPWLDHADASFVERVRLFESATSEALPGHLLLLRGDGRGATAAVRRALALNPEDREPWEIVGPPPGVRALVGAAGRR